MKQIIIFCFLFASLALAQRQSVVVLNSLTLDKESESKITPNQLVSLTNEVRKIVLKELPQDKFNLWQQDKVTEALKDDEAKTKEYADDCAEGKCVGVFIDKLEVNFGTRCDIYTVQEQLRLKCELYGKRKGESEAGTIDEFSNEPIKDIQAAIAMVWKKFPAMLGLITKSPQELCMATKGNIWMDGVCTSQEKMAQDACSQRSSEGYVWADGGCKSKEQLICEATKGNKWEGNECKSPEQQNCEKQAGKMWQNGACKSAVAVPVPAAIPVAPPAGGGGSGTFTAQVHSTPAGASVYVNGNLSCNSTPCNISVYERSIRITAAMNDHDNTDTTLTLATPGQLVNIKLNPKTYVMSFYSEPSGASLTLDGYRKCETPCRMNFAKGKVKVSAGLDSFYDRKDTTVTITGNNNQQVNLKLNPNYGTVDIKGASSDWNFKIGDKSLPLNNIRLLPGSYTAKLTNDDYEDIDFSVNISKNERKSFDISDKIVHKYGYLDISPAYSDGIGQYYSDNWYLMVGNEYYSFGEVKLLHGEHHVKLTHKCYEDIDFDTKIERNGHTSFDMQDKVALKQGTLVLRAKRKVRNISMPVFVNGKQVGETPFEGSVPICSEVRMGKDGGESVPVRLEHNKPVEYTYRDGTFKSHLLGAVLDVTGVVFLVQSMTARSDMEKYRKDYVAMEEGDRMAFDNAWKKEEDAHTKGNTFLIIGGAALVLGLGVHIWF